MTDRVLGRFDARSLTQYPAADRILITDPPTPEYRQVGWYCTYHGDQGRACHNPLDCDLVPRWALDHRVAMNRMEAASLAERARAREQISTDLKVPCTCVDGDPDECLVHFVVGDTTYVRNTVMEP